MKLASKKYFLSSKYLPVFITVSLVIGFTALWQFQLVQENRYQKDRIDLEAKRIELEINETLRQTSLALGRFAARIELLGTKNLEFINLDSRLYLEQLPILKRIGIIDSKYRVVWSYPKDLSNQVSGFDQSQNPDRRDALDRSRANRMPTISKTIELKSGGAGFLMPVAIFPSGKFSGFIYATVEAEKLFHSFVPEKQFQISIVENNKVLLKSRADGVLAEDIVHRHQMKWDNSVWTIELRPTEKFISEGRSFSPILILLSGIIVSLLIGAFLRNLFLGKTEAQANEDWKRALIESSDYAIISTDAEGLIKTFNQAATKILGYDSSEVIGKCTPKIFHTKEESVARSEALSAELGRKVEPGFDAFTVKARELKIADKNEWTYVRKDQSRFPVHLSVTAFYDSKGEVLGYLGICHDLTEKKKSQELLDLANDRLKRVIESTEEGIWEREFNSGGKIKFMDSRAKKLLGFLDTDEPSYAEVIAKLIPEDFAKTGEVLKYHVDNQTPGFEVEFRVRTADALKPKWARARGKVVNDAKNGPFLVSTLRDVSEEVLTREKLKSALAEAQDATKAKSEFLANMSHEIRTPINGVIGMTGLLLDSNLGPLEREYAETVRSSGEILLNLVNDILDFSKIEARKLELEIVDFDLFQTTQNIEQLLKFSAQKKGLKLSHLFSSDLSCGIFKGDSNRIGQVLANLLSNAIKFTNEGQVTVSIALDHLASAGKSVDSSKTALRVEVSDTGIGMSEVALARMFKPFSQAEASTSRRYGGTGLGLSICKHLVEMMGGQIGVRSKEGEGSTFWFTMELEKGEQAHLKKVYDNKSLLLETSFEKIRILLAEDNPVNQLIGRAMLEKRGFRVDVVANGNEAIEALRTLPYDLVLMDCQMPELDGYEATAKIRSSNDLRFCSVPIVAMTANAMSGDREKCITAGMNDYVTKPINADDLASAIHRVLGENYSPVSTNRAVA